MDEDLAEETCCSWSGLRNSSFEYFDDDLDDIREEAIQKLRACYLIQLGEQ